MKKHFLLFCLLVIMAPRSRAQSSMDQWKPLLDRPGLAEYFKGIFDYLGIKVKETGEEFTVHHLGQSFELIPGIDPKKVDFTVEIKKENVYNMVKHGSDSKIDDAESFKIMRVLFTPITESDLSTPFLTKKCFLKMAHTDELIHITLLDPEKKEDYHHTLIYSKKQWIVVPGIHGITKTELRLNPVDAVEFQRHLFAAKKNNTRKGWLKFARWYKTWKTAFTG